jgi:DHA2 family multidrug resistance protein-like MFS transporter
VTGVYRGFPSPAGTPDGAHESPGGAVGAAHALAAGQAQSLLDAARESFVQGLALAAGTDAAVLPATAVAAWFRLKGRRLEGAGAEPSTPSPQSSGTTIHSAS